LDKRKTVAFGSAAQFIGWVIYLNFASDSDQQATESYFKKMNQ